MSNGPVSGNAIPITLPVGFTVYYSGMTQASWNQFIQLKDSHGNVIFTLSGSGPYATQSFTASDTTGNYTVYIGTNGGSQWSQVVWDEEVLNIGNTVYFGIFNFISEDGTDTDYNDSYLALYWFTFSG
jgi:mannose-binding lectin